MDQFQTGLGNALAMRDGLGRLIRKAGIEHRPDRW